MTDDERQVLKVRAKLLRMTPGQGYTWCIVCGKPTVHTYACQTPKRDCWVSLYGPGKPMPPQPPPARFNLSRDAAVMLDADNV